MRLKAITFIVAYCLSSGRHFADPAPENTASGRIRGINHSFDIRGFAFLNPWLRFSTTYRYHPLSILDGRIRPYLGLDIGLAHFNCSTSSCNNLALSETQFYSSLLPGVMFIFPSTGGIIAFNGIIGVGHSYLSVGSGQNGSHIIDGRSYSAGGFIRGFEVSIFQYILGNYPGLLGLHFGIAPLYAADQTLDAVENGVKSQFNYNSGSIRTLSYRIGISIGTAF